MTTAMLQLACVRVPATYKTPAGQPALLNMIDQSRHIQCADARTCICVFYSLDTVDARNSYPVSLVREAAHHQI